MLAKSLNPNPQTHEFNTLQGRVTVRGSSDRPATVIAAEYPQIVHSTMYMPQRGAGYGKFLVHVFCNTLSARLTAIPLGCAGSGLHCGSRPVSKNITSMVIPEPPGVTANELVGYRTLPIDGRPKSTAYVCRRFHNQNASNLSPFSN
jgi:hypothetical protein